MRTLLDAEEEEVSKAAEITLSTASLLGIFFGLVLICGVFFGFGYSTGRGTGQGAQAAALGNVPAAAEPDETAKAANLVAPEPVQQDDMQAPVKAVPPSVRDSKPADAVIPEKAAKEDAPAPRSEVAAVKPSAAQQNTVLAAATASSEQSAVPATSQPMVQIAAVARREDADVLVSALRQRGYGVVIRSDPQDQLLHVQVGPFANRMQATAIKQKLLSDGYNAIIKQ